jgi:Subtilisin inhibitor-like
MRPCVACLLVALALAACAGTTAPATPQSRLAITVWAKGQGTPAKRYVLRCGPTGGTLPRAARACRLLASLPRPFAPVPRNAACTAIYGGPQEALVRGAVRGRRIWVRLNRKNGCEIMRWNAYRPFLPVAVG